MNSPFIIVPNFGAGEIRLGKSIGEIEPLLGKAKEQFKRNQLSQETTYIFGNGEVFITFANGIAANISLFPPLLVELNGIQLLTRPITQVSEELLRAGIEIENTDAGILCKGLGVHLVEVESLVDSVEIERVKDA
jgi:hypothetical protein